MFASSNVSLSMKSDAQIVAQLTFVLGLIGRLTRVHFGLIEIFESLGVAVPFVGEIRIKAVTRLHQVPLITCLLASLHEYEYNQDAIGKALYL